MPANPRSALLSLACWLAACSGSPPSGGPGPDGSPDAAPDGPAADARADGAPGEGGTSPPELAPGLHRRSVSSGGRERTYLLYVPSGYAPGRPHPLVLVFHGGGGSGEQVRRHTRFDEAADREGFLAAFPDGVARNWNDGRGTTDAEVMGVDDVAFVERLLDDVASVASVDPERVFATGISNGGMFVHRLGCELSERVRAIAPVVAALPSPLRPACRPARPVSVLAIQGTDDPFIPIDGGDTRHRTLGLGDGGPVESAADTLAHWVEVDGCEGSASVDLPPVDPEDPTRVTRHEGTGCPEGVAIHYYLVDGMGHVWPPREGRLPRVSGPTSRQLDATERIAAFFAAR